MRQTSHRHQHRFSWINEWTQRADAHGNADGIDLIVPDWFYRAVLDDALVLTIDPAYFSLTGGLERWLYRIVRKHGGQQRGGWRFDFATSTPSRPASLRSGASPSSFATSPGASRCRAIASGQRETGGRELLLFGRRSYPQAPVDKLGNRTCDQEPMATCHPEPADVLFGTKTAVFIN